jgi:hypothetical protein
MMGLVTLSRLVATEKKRKEKLVVDVKAKRNREER